MRVLLIEDDKAISQSIELMLHAEGFNVYTTDLGEEGAELGKLYDYDIILLDLNLPDISGHDVLKDLRASKISTPVLVLSGLAGIEDKVRGLGFGADDYLTKPFHKDELVGPDPRDCAALEGPCSIGDRDWRPHSEPRRQDGGDRWPAGLPHQQRIPDARATRSPQGFDDYQRD